jgi:signal transduction histidine kinase
MFMQFTNTLLASILDVIAGSMAELEQEQASLNAFYQQLQQELAERRQTEVALQQAMEREQQIREREGFIAAIAQNIRQSLDLNQVLTTTVAEVRQFLQVDRVVIYRFNADWSGTVIAESLVEGVLSILDRRIDDPCFRSGMAEHYRQGRVHMANDVLTLEVNPCYVNMLLAVQARAVLAIPIVVRQELWGLLVAHQCTAPRQWQQVSWSLLRQLSTQLAIAIQQSELYQQVNRLNANLEQQVQTRTAELQVALHYEAILKRITDAVRDSLNENEILQTAVHELGSALGVKCCDTALYSSDRTTSVICYDYLDSMQSARGVAIATSSFPEGYSQLLSGQYLHFCQLPGRLPEVRAEATQSTILACPLMDDQGVLGDMWLYKTQHDLFSDLELRLVQQVANQCAIALRQSRFYQAAQAQVEELERLSRLKDDFLSTVSHELRTPMASIKMAIQMLEMLLFREVESSTQEAPFTESSLTLSTSVLQRLSRYFHILEDECEQEIGLINNLLDLSRLGVSTEPLVLTTVEPQTWLMQFLHPFQERAQRQQQQLILEVPDGLPNLTTDVSKLERILTELLDNACKYTPLGERIILSGRVISSESQEALSSPETSPFSATSLIPQPAVFLIRITNSGIEIPPSEHDRIFEKFYRIPSQDPWRHRGTGLGLALVKKLVTKLGATIAVHSLAGQTTFTLRLPTALPPS